MGKNRHAAIFLDVSSFRWKPESRKQDRFW